MKLKRRRFGIYSLAAIAMLLLLNIGCEKERLTEPELELKTGSIERNNGENYLIGFYETPDASLIRGVGGEVSITFKIVPAVAARLAPQAIEALARNPKIRYVEPDYEVFATSQTVPWGINRVFGDETYSFPTWLTSTGNEISVAILDTGIDDHADLPAATGGKNTVGGTSYKDGNGHGTHVAGTVAALDNTWGVVGVAPGVSLYAVKVLDDGGIGSVSTVVAGIEWAVTNGIKVLNMSLGSSSSSTTLLEACNTAYNAGHLIVASAGNSGNAGGRGNNVGYPAAYESVIAVAASTSNNQRASYSSTGPAVELIAPGSSILSTLPGNKYGTYSGTSMASPHVAGIAALTWAANTSLTNVEVRMILRETAENLGLSANHQGYGLARADLAVRAVAVVEPPATGKIEGTVKGDDDAIIKGATVVVEETGLSAITDANGYYLLENVPAGEQNVTASANGYYSERKLVTVVKDDATVIQNFVLTAIPTASTYTVSGTVTDAGGALVEGATVTIEGTNKSATTDNNGLYSISTVEGGTYDITASKNGYSSKTTNSVSVTSNTTVNFVLEEVTVAGAVRVESIVYTASGGRLNDRHLSITLLLRDDQNKSVAGASVSATLNQGNNSWSFQGTSGSDGTVTFSLNNHGSGAYETKVTTVAADGLVWDGLTPENGYSK